MGFAILPLRAPVSGPAMFGDRVDQDRYQPGWQIVPHPRNDLQTGAWDVFRRMLTRGGGNERIVGAMNDQGRSGDAPQHFHPAARGRDGKYLMDEPRGIVRARKLPLDLGAEFLVRDGITWAADRAEGLHAPADSVLVAEKP
jgi:hypothetical protein